MSKNSPFFSEERDGKGWLETLEKDNSYFEKWKRNLAIAEITGYYTYRAVVKAFSEPSLIWSGKDLTRFICNAEIIAEQELNHYRIVSGKFHITAEPVEHEQTFAELDINERRSEMRLNTIIRYSANPELIKLATRLISDEAYHCRYTKSVLNELGDFVLPRRT